MNRHFVRSSLDADHRASAYKIVCRQCGKTDKVAASSHSGNLPPEVTIKKFRQRGWAVGNRAGDDMCNICVASNKIVRKPVDNVAQIPALKLKDLSRLKELQKLVEDHLVATKPEVIPAQEVPVEKLYSVKDAEDAGFADLNRIYRAINNNKISRVKNARGVFVLRESDLIRVFGNPKRAPVQPPKTVLLNAPAPAPAVVEPKPLLNDGVKQMNFDPKLPPEMTKEDRRIIFSEIDSHYLDETRGYDRDWNDERVAKSLNVPLAWVRNIREDNFGPEYGDVVNVEVDKLRAAIVEIQAIKEEASKLLVTMDAKLMCLQNAFKDIEEKMKKVTDVIKDAKAKIDTVTRK